MISLKNYSNLTLRTRLFLRVSLTTMKKSELKRLPDILSEELFDKDDTFPFSQLYSAALDSIDCRAMNFKKLRNSNNSV